MQIELQWLTKMSPSCFHAADMVLRGLPLADDGLAEAMTGPADVLQREIERIGVSGTTFLGHVIPLSAGIESNRELARLALTKAIGRQEAATKIERIAGAFTSFESAFSAAHPHLADELSLRAASRRTRGRP